MDRPRNRGTDGSTDGQTLLQICEDASKKVIFAGWKWLVMMRVMTVMIAFCHQQDQQTDKMTDKSTKWPIESCAATKKGLSWLSLTYIQGHYQMKKSYFCWLVMMTVMTVMTVMMAFCHQQDQRTDGTTKKSTKWQRFAISRTNGETEKRLFLLVGDDWWWWQWWRWWLWWLW